LLNISTNISNITTILKIPLTVLIPYIDEKEDINLCWYQTKLYKNNPLGEIIRRVQQHRVQGIAYRAAL
jgi:hypothetical protein